MTEASITPRVRDLTPTELEDLAIAKDAYAIFCGNSTRELFVHRWEGLPQHYRDLLGFVVAHARHHEMAASKQTPVSSADGGSS